MKLMFDVPKEYSDMDSGEIPRLYMKIKQLVDQLEYEFNVLSNKRERIIRAELSESEETTRIVYDNNTRKSDIIEIYSQFCPDNLWVSKVFDGGFEVSGGTSAVSIIAIIREVSA